MGPFMSGNLMKHTFKKIILLFTIFAFISISAEVALRVYLNYFARKNIYFKYATLGMIIKSLNKGVFQFSTHPYLMYLPTPNYTSKSGNKHNSLGYRGDEIVIPKPEGEYRIVCIGGSTTYTSNVGDYKESYPYLLEKKLKEMGHNVTVVNAGVNNASTWYSLINLEFRILNLDPDMVIVYHGDNDAESRLVFPVEFYRGDNTGVVAPITDLMKRLNLIDRSVLLRILGNMFFGYFKPFGSIYYLYSAKSSVHKEYYRQLKNSTYPSGIFKHTDVLDILQANPPVYTERNIRNMVAVADANNVDVVLSSFTYSPVSRLTSSEFYQQAVKENNEIIEDIASEYNVPFFDFKSVMPINDEYWANDGIHLKRRGAELKAVLFANFVEDYINDSIR